MIVSGVPAAGRADHVPPLLRPCAGGCWPPVIVYMAFSLLMAVLWSLLQSPDLAITEAAVGAGVTSILFFLTLKKIHALKGTRDE